MGNASSGGGNRNLYSQSAWGQTSAPKPIPNHNDTFLQFAKQAKEKEAMVSIAGEYYMWGNVTKQQCNYHCTLFKDFASVLVSKIKGGMYSW
jgi:hypothetical protein